PPPPPPAPGADQVGDPRPGLGLRLRDQLQLAGGLRRPSSAQDRGRRRAQAPAHRAGGWLCTAGAGRVSLRARLTLLAAAAVAAAVALASVAAFLITRAELRHQVDTSLVQVARGIAALQQEGLLPGLLSERRRNELDQRLPMFGVQWIQRDGSARPAGGPGVRGEGGGRPGDRGERGTMLRDRRAGGVHLRVITLPLQGTGLGALQLARPLTEEDRTLGRLALVRGLVAVAGVVGSAMLGLVVARAGLTPVDRLTERAEYVARTQDLGALLEQGG